MISITSNPSTLFTQSKKVAAVPALPLHRKRTQNSPFMKNSNPPVKDSSIISKPHQQSKTTLISSYTPSLFPAPKAEFHLRTVKNSKRSKSTSNVLHQSLKEVSTIFQNSKTPDIYSISSRSKTGSFHNKVKEFNQDNFLTLKHLNNDPGQALLAVFDGNGPEGHKVSRLLRELYSKWYPRQLEKEESRIFKRCLHDFSKIFIRKLEKALNCLNVDLQFSGSTFLTVHINAASVVVANVGDSKALVAGYEKTWSFREINKIHRPCQADEMRRILAMGGEVKRLRNQDGDEVGNLRVWGGKNQPGLNVSRSLGDFYLKDYGLVSEPDIYSFQLKDSEKMIVLASDGLWDNLPEPEVLEILKANYESFDSDSAVHELIRISSHRALKKDSHSDDITVAVLFRK